MVSMGQGSRDLRVTNGTFDCTFEMQGYVLLEYGQSFQNQPILYIVSAILGAKSSGDVKVKKGVSEGTTMRNR